MPELTDAQKVLRNDTGKRMADALEALAGTGGRGLPAGGTDGDVLVKNGATDYAATWKKTPPQMASLATIEPTSNASKSYAAGDYLVYNGQLYKVTGTISPDETLTPGGNIQAVTNGGFNDLNALTTYRETDFTNVNSNLTFADSTVIIKNKIAVCSIAIRVSNDIAGYANLFTLPVAPAIESNILYVDLATRAIPFYVRSDGIVRGRKVVPATEFGQLNFVFMVK